MKSRFALIQEVERLGEPTGDTDALALASELVAKVPTNLVALLERSRLAAKCVDRDALSDSVARLAPLAPTWSPGAQQYLRDLERDAKAKPESSGLAVVRLRNVLLQTPAFRKDLAVVQSLQSAVADPVATFLKLELPPPSPSPVDESISYDVRSIDVPGLARCYAIAAVPLAGGEPPVMFAADTRAVRRLATATELPFPGNPATPPSPHSILAADWNSDYRMDFIFAGAGGLKLWLQKEDGSFAEVTESSGLSAAVRAAAYVGVWAADIDMDGDLDFVLGSAGNANVTVLRNHGDGTFTAVQPFEGAGRAARLRLGRSRSGRRPRRRASGRKRNCAHLHERARRQVSASPGLGQPRDVGCTGRGRSGCRWPD